MDCESPPTPGGGGGGGGGHGHGHGQHAHRIAPPPAHQGSRWEGRHSNNGGVLHTGHQFTTHRGHHHHHHGGHQSGPLAAVQSSTTSLSSTSSSSSSALPGPQNMGAPGHAYGPPPDVSHPHPQRPGQAGAVALAAVAAAATTNSVPVDLSTLQHHGHSATQVGVVGVGVVGGGGLQGIEPQLGSLSMQLGGYPPPSSGQYSQFPQQGWPAANYPFTITQAAAASSSSSSSVPQPLAVAHSEGAAPPPVVGHRTAAEPRGEESPMVGVCVQQSPVASH